jgi:hypothetical protein
MARLPGRRTLRRVKRHRERPTRMARSAISGSTRGTQREGPKHGEPQAGCRVQQTCRLPMAPLVTAGPAAEQTVEAGRNGKDGSHPGVATRVRVADFGRPCGDGRSGRAPAEGTPMNPTRGVWTADREVERPDRVNWRASPKRTRTDVIRKEQARPVVKANQPPDTTRESHPRLRSKERFQTPVREPPGGRTTGRTPGLRVGPMPVLRPVRCVSL